MTSPSPRRIGVPGSVQAVTLASDDVGVSRGAAAPSGAEGWPGPLCSGAPQASQNLPESVVTDPHEWQFIACQLPPSTLRPQHRGSADLPDVGMDYGAVFNGVGALKNHHGAVRLAGA